MAGWGRSGAAAAARADLADPQDLRLPVRVPVGARHVPALPLRPADAAGLEGVPAVFAVLAGAHGGRVAGLRVAAPCVTHRPGAGAR